MKRLLLFLSLTSPALAAVSANGYSPAYIYVLEQLRQCRGQATSWTPGEPDVALPLLGGSDTGLGMPGQFFMLLPYFKSAQADDVARMVKDHSPVVRVLGAYLTIKGGKRLASVSLAALENDRAFMEVAAGGCLHERLTVAQVVKRIRDEPDFLGERWYASVEPAEASRRK